MSTQTALGHSFPTPCKRCGGALYRQVDYCPYCGAVHPLDTSPHRREVIPGSRASATNQGAPKLDADSARAYETDVATRTARSDEATPSEVALHTSLISPDMPIPPLTELPLGVSNTRVIVRRVLFAILAVVVIGLAYVAYALFSDSSDSEDSGTDQNIEITQDARTTTGTIGAAQSTHSPDAAANAIGHAPSADLNTAPKTTPVAPVAPLSQVAPVAPVAPPVAAAPLKPAAPQFRDATQALQAAQVAFHANNLSAAQAALGAAQALQPDNADAQSLAAQLRPLNARRDTALQAAQVCVAQQSWTCARTHANEALVIDTGSDAAKSILERVIRETGWAPLNPNATTGAAQNKTPQAPTASTSQQAQLQTAAPQGMPANNVDARERAIKDSGWRHAPANGAPPSQ